MGCQSKEERDRSDSEHLIRWTTGLCSKKSRMDFSLTSEELWLVDVDDGVGAKLSVFTSSEVVVVTCRGSLGGRGERGRSSLSLVEGSITSL